MEWERLRRSYHRELCQRVLCLVGGVPNNADKNSRPSVAVAQTFWEVVCANARVRPFEGRRPPQTVGRLFEEATLRYLQQAFLLLRHLRPGNWLFEVSGNLYRFAQYRHLAQLKMVLQRHPDLHTALGDYLIHPDIVIARRPVPDAEINRGHVLLTDRDSFLARLTPLRQQNNEHPLLHASISCKWTMRSDRAQNVRAEALNLIRNRKGHTPHIVVVTAEPLPGRLASLALGTGDLDCVYHVGLYELEAALKAFGEEALLELFYTMVQGQRLRDIADLPFDLVA